MKKLLLLATSLCALHLSAETLRERYAQYGEVILTQLPSAPFPHPKRADGHKFRDKIYTAEKNYSDSSVAIFVPKGFHPGSSVDFVVHFHGWNNHVEKVVEHYQLISQFAASGRNAILVVPQGPHDASDSFDGKLEDEGGFKRFMTDVMETLRKEKAIESQSIGKIILSGHSGGYQVISSIVAVGGLTDNVKEVWLFDALYAQTPKFVNWQEQTHGRIISLYTEHDGTKGENEKLMADLKGKNVEVVFKPESEITPKELQKNPLVFIFSELEHDSIVNQRNEFRAYLETSCLGGIKSISGAK
jgi:hypothetical protein